MNKESQEALQYQRARFSCAIPLHYRYTPDHLWIAPQEGSVWRVGFTRFGSRTLGEVVDFGFEVCAGQSFTEGQLIGWIEGFKAIKELHAPGEGGFVGANDQLETQITLINHDPQKAGWLFAFRGTPAQSCLDAHGYAVVLDQLIDAWLSREKS